MDVRVAGGLDWKLLPNYMERDRSTSKGAAGDSCKPHHRIVEGGVQISRADGLTRMERSESSGCLQSPPTASAFKIPRNGTASNTLHPRERDEQVRDYFSLVG